MTAATTPQDDWRSETLDKVRILIQAADPDIIEAVKWRKPSNNMQGVPVWEYDGIICTGETYKAAVKLTFAGGAALDDPSHLFNASLDGGTRRAIDIHEGDTIDETAFKALILAAVEANKAAGADKKIKKLSKRILFHPRRQYGPSRYVTVALEDTKNLKIK
jgi:hypothetical protein